MMRSVASFAAVALAAAFFVPRYAAQMNTSHPSRPAPVVVAARPGPAPAAVAPADSSSVVVTRGPNGRFEIAGSVDGRRMDFLVDTGASMVALTERDAAMLGIHPAESDYVAPVTTANGTVRAARTQLSMVEIDNIVLHDVDAMVLPDGSLSNNLLGMSFLSRLRRWEYADDKLVLEQ
jgi:aspartyl protease family protein